MRAVIVSFLFAASVFAQSNPFENKPGEWGQEIQPDVPAEYVVSAAGAKAFAQRLGALADVLRGASVFNPPLGFQPRFHARVWAEGDCFANPPGKCNERVVPAQLHMLIYYFVEGRNGEAVWGGEANTGAAIWVNDLRATLVGTKYEVFGAPGLSLPDGRRICFRPNKSGEVAGFPFYDDSLLIITENPRPYWVPVTREDCLQAMIRFHETELGRNTRRLSEAKDPYQEWLSKADERRAAREKAYQRMKATDPAKAEQFKRQSEQMEVQMGAGLQRSSGALTPKGDGLKLSRNIIDALKSELERMTPDQRKSEAWLLVRRPAEELYASGLVSAGAAGARPVATVNPEFFDRSRPRTDWQLLTSHFSWQGYSKDFIGAKRLREFCGTADWKRVASLMD